MTPRPVYLDGEAIARAVLARLHEIHEPTPSELATATEQVRRDPAGSAWLASGQLGSPPEGRDEELRRARSRGTYLAGSTS